MFNKYHFLHYNFKLVILTIAIAIVGILAIGSADESLQNTQIWGVVVGFVLMVLLSLLDYNVIIRFFWVYYIANFILLFMVIFLGEKGNGAQRWIKILGIRFQPSELCKVIIILSLAGYIYKYKEDFDSFKHVIICALIFIAPAALVYKQPDLSTTIILCLIFAVIMFVADTKWRVILGFLAIAIPAFLIVLYLIMQPDQTIVSEYQKSRIMSFFNKESTANDEGYQQTYSVMAIGSGQLSGKGYRNNEIYSVKNADFIAEQQTDFIFAVIGEEFGFAGTCSVIVLLLLISVECLMIGFRSAELSGRIIAAGVGAWLGFQAFINIGVVTYILPNTGLPLPFVSYGLTSLISSFIGIGIVLNVGLQCKEK
ncbi:MAG: rod shape-determining protein RodA [Lachnospiraceae bacterium]|nr:rod shape-determining protein RodA [Lachnospiraceae bacterium]